ncbi:hypothetical protein OAT16_04900 [Prolixibacteraceae bacterium]|nr:hypothetical protein [Prolixibacteraceae bacterium]
MLEIIQQDFDCSIYQTTKEPNLNCYLISTPETRHICSDPSFIGDHLTHGLTQALSRSLVQLKINNLYPIEQKNTSLLIPTENSFAFPIREALKDAWGWHRYNTFFSAKDLIDAPSRNLIVTEQGTTDQITTPWFESITSSKYDNVQNIYVFCFSSEVYIKTVMDQIEKHNTNSSRATKNISFFVFEGLFSETNDNQSQEVIFSKKDANLAPEYVDNHYFNPVHSITRCPINSLSERIFAPLKYINKQISYWNNVIEMANNGKSYIELSTEKYPFIDASAFGDISLKDEATKIIDKLK